MVLDLQRQDPGDKTVISRVARQLGVGLESLRTWVEQTAVDAGTRPGVTTTEGTAPFQRHGGFHQSAQRTL